MSSELASMRETGWRYCPVCRAGYTDDKPAIDTSEQNPCTHEELHPTSLRSLLRGTASEDWRWEKMRRQAMADGYRKALGGA